MAKEKFLQAVHEAAQHPNGFGDEVRNARKSPGEKAGRKIPGYLNPATVAAYRPSDYADLSPEKQRRLEKAVEQFKRATAPGSSRIDEATARTTLQELDSQLGELVREEWLRDLDQFLSEAESWCQAKEWLTKRFRKTMTEPPLGTYVMPTVLIYAEGSQFQIDPVARYVFGGGTGLVDIAKAPSFNRVNVVRADGKWTIHIHRPLESRSRRIMWNRVNFYRVIEMLRREE